MKDAQKKQAQALKQYADQLATDAQKESQKLDDEYKTIQKLNNGGSVKATDLARSMGIEVISN